MATQTIATQTTQSEGPAAFRKVTDFLYSVGELLDLYFNAPMRLDILDEKYRARLSAHERAAIDQALNSIGPY